MQEHDLCTYFSYKLSDFPCFLLTHIHIGRTHKTLWKRCSRGKLAAVQELNSRREYIHILDSTYLSTKIRHSWLSCELTLQVLAFLLHAQSKP